MNDQVERWELILSQAAEKPNDKAPDSVGEANIGSTLYDVADWFGEINQGRPYIGLQLTSKGNVSQKVNIFLWEKQKRQTSADPHFKTREKLNGREFKFAAWIQPIDVLYQLRILIEPFTASKNDFSEDALITHRRLEDFVKKFD